MEALVCLFYKYSIYLILAQVYLCKIDDYLMREIREWRVLNSAPSGVVPLSLVFYLLEEGS